MASFFTFKKTLMFLRNISCFISSMCYYVITDKKGDIKMNFLTDPKISFKAKGIMATILNEGYVNGETMLSRSKDGRRSYDGGISELKEQGYIELKQVNDDGRIKWVLNILKK